MIATASIAGQDVLSVNTETVDALSTMLHRDRPKCGRTMLKKSQDLNPAPHVQILYSTAIGGSDRRNPEPMRKDVTAKMLRGTLAQIANCRDKQKAGKKKNMRQFAVDIPQKLSFPRSRGQLRQIIRKGAFKRPFSND